jgi:hypothetical protein
MKKISPDLKFKYVNGFGDFVAAVLHCKAFGWLTKIITGQDTPCQSCSLRRQALNILIPFPLWKAFFKEKKDLLEYLAAEYRGMGLEVEIDYDGDKISVTDPKDKKQNAN